MNLQSIMNQFTSSSTNTQDNKGLTDKLGQMRNMIPGGLAGGAMAGGVMALLIGNKSARKFAGTAATYGGAALLGGMAYKAFKNWQQDKHNKPPLTEDNFTSAEMMSADYQLSLIKAMIAAAQADGHIDTAEQQRIFDAIKQMDASTELKAEIFDLLQRPIRIHEFTLGATSLEQKTELYLVSCLVCNLDNLAEKSHLTELAGVLNLPPDLIQHLQQQAQQTLANA